MRLVRVCALLLLTSLVAGCAESPAAPLDAAFTQKAQDSVAQRYKVEAIVGAVAIDGDVDLSGTEMNIITGQTSPFDLDAADSEAGDGRARSWLHRFVATDSTTGGRGYLLLQTFEDGSTPRERFEAFPEDMDAEDKAQVACHTPPGPIPVGSEQAARTAMEQPGLQAFSQGPGQFVYHYVPALKAGEACPDQREVWRIEYLDLARSLRSETMVYVPAGYVVEVDAVTGAVLKSESQAERGYEVALMDRRELTVDTTEVANGHEVVVPFNVTLEGADLYGAAFAWGMAGSAPSASFVLVDPAGTEHAPTAAPVEQVIPMSGDARFLIEDAAAGQWQLVYRESAPTTPGTRDVRGHMVALVGDGMHW